MNIYKVRFSAACPADGAGIEYRLEVCSESTIYVEKLNAATSVIYSGIQEEIADRLHAEFGGIQVITAVHQGVEVVTVRGCQ